MFFKDVTRSHIYCLITYGDMNQQQIDSRYDCTLNLTGNTKHLMTGPEGNSKFCFLRISMFPSTSSRETLRFEGNKIHCSPRDQSLSDLLYSKTKQKQNLKTALKFQRSRATAVNISRVTVNCFPFDVIVFTMLPAHGIWRETVSLLDVM